jgi:hypothetical protein
LERGAAERVCGDEWREYYSRFPYFSHETIRDGCHPWKLVKQDSDKVIVLIHGLTDSPFFMMDLAEYFYSELGYSVFLPLLHCHGLRNPKGMEGVKLEEWKKNVEYAVKTACRYGRTVSIGGLSIGGALSLYAMENLTKINGCLYLFSAALELAGGVIGSAKEKLLRSSLVDVAEFFNRKRALVGEHPYRYAFMDMGAARELAELLIETTKITESYSENEPFSRWVFAAHSQGDEVAGIHGIERLCKRSVAERFIFWRVPKEENVSHAGLVLASDILSLDGKEGELLEKGNPLFSELLQKIEAFESLTPVNGK